jgi:hypothetical protein
MPRNPTSYGRVQVAESPGALLRLHIHDGATQLREVDHEPKVAVLDQEDLLAQGIRCSQFIAGAQDVDALGSCTANATTSALSNLLPERRFAGFVYGPNVGTYARLAYTDTKAAEEAAIRFYHACTDQTGDPAQEWPPTDCGSSGPYIVSELQRQNLCTTDRIAHGPDNLVSLLQADGVLMGSPWLMAWEEPDAHGFIDGDGSIATLEAQLKQGVAGGHETYLSAIEKISVLASGHVDPFGTVLRIRNSWSPSWGDHGSCRIHLSTLVALGGACDFRQLVA